MQDRAGLRQDLPYNEPDVTGTRSLDMPPALQQLFAMSPPQMPTEMGMEGGIGSRMGIGTEQFGSAQLPSYELGGMVGDQGMPVPMGAAPSMPMGAGLAPEGGAPAGQPIDPQMLEMNVNQFASQHPQEMEQIKAAIMQELQSGELTPQELNQIVQLTTVAAQNPEMYPQLRQFAIQQGVATEQDLPEQYDPALVYTLMIAAKAVQDMGGMDMQQAPMGQPPMGQPPMEGPIASMAKGGPVPGGSGASKPVVIEAHSGEYVIPKNVVEMKGKEFFDNLVEKYRGGK